MLYSVQHLVAVLLYYKNLLYNILLHPAASQHLVKILQHVQHLVAFLPHPVAVLIS